MTGDPMRWLGLGRARLLVGDDAGATRAFEELAQIGRRSGSPPLLARAALGFSADLSGFEVRLFDQRQIDLLEEADTALVDQELPALRSAVLARLSVALSLTASDRRRLDLAEEAVALARTADDDAVLGQALAAHCDAISGPADVAQRELEATEILRIAGAVSATTRSSSWDDASAIWLDSSAAMWPARRPTPKRSSDGLERWATPCTRGTHRCGGPRWP